MYKTLGIAILFWMLCLPGCGGSKAPDGSPGQGSARTAAGEPDPSKWPFTPKAIEIRLVADKELNRYEDKPHTLALAIYQLSDATPFNNLTKTPQEMAKMLEANRFDPSVTAFNQVIIHPGEEKLFIFDRMEKTQFVGIVAGYYTLYPDYASRLYEIPVVTESKGWIFRDYYGVPVKLTVNLYLGPLQLQKFGSK